jgi:hypothetical protein
MPQIYYTPKAMPVSDNGSLMAGAKLSFYATGTSTPKDTYSDYALTTSNSNPVVADGTGKFAPIFLARDVLYRVTLTNSLDVVQTGYPIDNVCGPIATLAELGAILYPQTPAELAAGVTPTNYGFDGYYARRYGAPIDGVASAVAAITAADSVAVAGVALTIFSPGTYLIDSNLTLNAGAYILPGAKFSISTGKTLTFAANSKLVAGDTMQIFSGLGNVTYATDTVAETFAAWFGFGHAFTAAQNKAALGKAMSALTSGGTIVLPKTGFNLDGDIVPPYDCLLIKGQGWQSGYNNTTLSGTTIVAASGTNLFDLSAHFGTGAPNEYFKLEGCKVDGNGVVANGIKIMGTKTVSGCLFTGFTGIGIWLADFINQTLIENTTCISNGAAGSGVGLLVDGTSTTKYRIVNCNFRVNFRGMEIRSGSNYTLQDCVYESNVERGLLERNSDNRNLLGGEHINLWFENNNSLAGTRVQFGIDTTASSSTWYPRSNRWIGGNINGSSVAGQRVMAIGANVLDTVFSGLRVANIAADTDSISIAAGTRTIFDDCVNTAAGETIDTAATVSVGNYRQRQTYQSAVLQVTTIAYSASMTIDCSTGNEFTISATNGTAFTIVAPTVPSIGQRITITVRNASGGALGAATWNAVFKMSAWTNPANGNSRSIDFRYDGTNWVQISQTGVDVPN